ncbi:MAG: hypothetical protein Q4G08_08305 [Capnocytophaga sp.]|nr:hypothetical protein [Capnocytophaga sp.]
MYRYLFVLFCLAGCRPSPTYVARQITLVEQKTFEINGSVRAMALLDGNIGFAGSGSLFGFIHVNNQTISVSTLRNKGIEVDFRSVGVTSTDFMMLSAGNPALLFKTGEQAMQEVYREEHPSVFYDSMVFWDNSNGIAVGDTVEGCMSILRTYDGGRTWIKQNCDKSPHLSDNETLFAASNSNIAITGKGIHIITGGAKSRLWTSTDKGASWKNTTLPIVQGSSTEGAFSIAFYDDNQGIVAGGNYQKPDLHQQTIATTSDGGKSWQTTDASVSPGYISCVRYVPNTQGHELLATSINGIWFSNDKGNSWKKIADEAYHALLFVDERMVAASGENKITLFRIK